MKAGHISALGTTVLLAAACSACTLGPAHRALLPSACSLAVGHASGAIASVPFRIIDGRIYVDATVNGRGPFAFAVDTGASGMGRLDATLTTALALPKTGAARTSDGVSTAEADTVRLATLAVGTLARSDLDVITRDYNSRMAPEAALSGIIARDFFADGLLIIDYPARILSFRRDRAIGPEHLASLAYERPFRVAVKIGGIDTTGNLDTGANINFVLPRALFDRLEASPLEDGPEGTLMNNRISTDRATIKGPITVGDIRVRDVPVRVSDRFPELLVGSHALQDHVILIDQRSKRVAICGNRAGP